MRKCMCKYGKHEAHDQKLNSQGGKKHIINSNRRLLIRYLVLTQCNINVSNEYSTYVGTYIPSTSGI